MLKIILPLHEMLPWDHINLCAHTQKIILHKNPHSKEMEHDGVYNTHIHHRNSSHDCH
jgi:hypothetical protein